MAYRRLVRTLERRTNLVSLLSEYSSKSFIFSVEVDPHREGLSKAEKHVM